MNLLSTPATTTPNPMVAELEKVSARFHVIGAWVAIIFDPIFGITDYYNIPHAWMTVFGPLPLRRSFCREKN
jgi:hypothetical protein